MGITVGKMIQILKQLPDDYILETARHDGTWGGIDLSDIRGRKKVDLAISLDIVKHGMEAFEACPKCDDMSAR